MVQAGESMRGKPPLRMGDEAAFEEVNPAMGTFVMNKPAPTSATVTATKAAPPVSLPPLADTGDGSVTSGGDGVGAGTNSASMSARAMSGIGDDLGPVGRKTNTNVTAADFELPSDIASLLKQSASKFAKTLGLTRGDDAE